MPLLAVNGTLMRGLELEPNMLAAGATFVCEAATAPLYRLFDCGRHPGMLRVSDGSGVAVALELWDVPPAGLGQILEKEPAGLSIGVVQLADGQPTLGVLAEAYRVEGCLDVSAHGGWRAFKAAPPAPSPLPTVREVPSAAPYAFAFPTPGTGLLLVDFQRDFCEAGGFGEALGNDPSACSPPAAPRSCPSSIHTLEAHAPDLSDLCALKLTRGCPPPGRRIGDVGALGRILVRGEPGNGLISELAAAPGEALVHKRGKGAFYATGLEGRLRAAGITHLLVAGVTTEVCVAATLREAADRGFECALVPEATGSYFPAFREATLAMLVAQGGICSFTAPLSGVLAALQG